MMRWGEVTDYIGGVGGAEKNCFGGGAQLRVRPRGSMEATRRESQMKGSTRQGRSPVLCQCCVGTEDVSQPHILRSEVMFGGGAPVARSLSAGEPAATVRSCSRHRNPQPPFLPPPHSDARSFPLSISCTSIGRPAAHT